MTLFDNSTQHVLNASSQPAPAPDQKGIHLNSSTSTPTAEQLSAARLTQWHQDAAPLLTIEDLRAWITRSGLVLWSSRAQQLPAPAPSLVEATLGTVNAAPSLEQQASARSLLARLIAEGVAVPLNLLGVTGGTGTDTPDFVVSAPVFSYIFTLRGNKAWKQSPVTSGPVKVSPLALAAYEILAAKVTLSAYDLTTQLGKEVTEAAVLRALTELWSQLRVLPIPQQDGSATLWELSTARFTKQIKAGANAGQPSALSALISLYLGQAIAATEEEIETFLSPLAPRSRVRDVIHALLGARQLETFVVEGKTLLHIGGDLPAFAAPADSAEPGDAVAELNQELTATSEDGSRIRKYTPKPGSKIGTGLRTKPAFGARSGKPGFGSKPAFGPGDRERRPFKRDGDRPARPSFSKPWEEDRKPRPEAADGEQGSDAPRTYTPRPSRPYGDRPSAGAGRPGQRPGGFGAKRSFGGDREGSGPRKTFSKPGTFGRKREGSFEASGGDVRPPRRDFGDRPRPSFDRADRPERSDRGERPAAGGFKRPGSYSPRPAFGSKPGFGAKPSFRGPRPEGGERPERPAAGGFARKPFTPREGGGDRPAFDRKPSFGAKPSFSRERGESTGASGPDAPRKVFRKFDAPRSPKPFGSKPKFGGKPSFGSDRGERGPVTGSDRPARPSFGAKPGGPRPGGGKTFGDKKPSAFAGKGGPFAKFADGKKPFRKPGPGKPRPAGGGFTPTRRKRPEGGA